MYCPRYRCKRCHARLQLANLQRSRKEYLYRSVDFPTTGTGDKQAMPPSSDPSSKKTGKQRKSAVRLRQFARILIDSFTDSREVQTVSSPTGRGRSASHRGNLSPLRDQSLDNSANRHALVPLGSAAHRGSTRTAPPSYNDETSTTYDQDDEATFSSEEASAPPPPGDEESRRGRPNTHHQHHCDYHNVAHHNDRTYITQTTHVNLGGSQLNGHASSGKQVTDFVEKFMDGHLKSLEKFMAEQLSNARASSGS